MKHRYKPAPKTSKSRLHMNDFDVYGEQQQRMLDMTYDSIEMSEEEEDIVSKKYTRNNPQTNAASVLRDVLLDLIDRESKRNNQVQKRKVFPSSFVCYLMIYVFRQVVVEGQDIMQKTKRASVGDERSKLRKRSFR